MAGEFSLAPASLTDALFDALRLRIINGEISPGEKLTEARVAGEYSVARPTAKACLERLTAAGLLQRTAHKSAVVPRLTVAEIDDLFVARAAVERAAVGRLASSGQVPNVALEAQERIARAAAEEAFRDQVAADIAFHSALVDATSSKRLARMHELIMGEVHLSMGQYQAHRTADPGSVSNEHADILAAIEAQDQLGAEAAILTHLDNAKGRLIARAQDAESS